VNALSKDVLFNVRSTRESLKEHSQYFLTCASTLLVCIGLDFLNNRLPRLHHNYKAMDLPFNEIDIANNLSYIQEVAEIMISEDTVL